MSTSNNERLVLFCGSRTWPDYLAIYRMVKELHVLLGSFTLLHGGARGADTFAGMAAVAQNIPVRVMRPNWTLGKFAGHLRNSNMLKQQPLMVVAFWSGSGGTLDTITKAVNEYRIPTVIVRGLPAPTRKPFDHYISGGPVDHGANQ